MMEVPAQLHQMPAPLLAWYDGAKRVLPWRDAPTAYHVWISEIMLQQTRVSAVLPYYKRFLAALPDVRALAEADEGTLMKLWEGLGYYSRARNLQKAARLIVTEHGGRFPDTYKGLLALPGVGEYTAGAIASIAFGRCVPAVDGNVLRVLARSTGDEGDILDGRVRKRDREWLQAVMPADRPGEFNQALMELGATVCLPGGAPRCGDCPLRSLCKAREGEGWRRLPVKRAKKARRVEEKTVFVLVSPAGLALRQREASGLLAGLWELPNVAGTLDESGASAQATAWGLDVARWEKQLTGKHIFTHVEWRMRGYVLRVRGGGCADFCWTDRDRLKERAVPAAFGKFLKEGMELLEEKGTVKGP